MAKNYTETRVYPMNINVVADCIRSLANAGAGFSLHNEQPEGNGAMMSLGHKVSMTSYGELITVKLIPEGNQTSVNIFSKNAWPLQLGDGGHNKKNAEAIFEAIERQIH